ncbi:cyclase family protein [Kitasatospora sp. LaBMicrA B282]|uniref:cyclase family protein n=1 Tax=Kitasatospora sp. LaBMicrA B282 TaxID=3420949 RepID=UPI003D09BB75
MSIGRRAVVELGHVVRQGMTTLPGVPGPDIVDHLSRADSRARYAPGTEFQIDRISMVANTGTYLDVPYHRFEGGTDLAHFDLARLVDLPGLVVRATAARGAARGIGPEAFAGLAVAGRAVLVHTGWDAHFGTAEYGADHPFLTEGAVRRLVEQGAALVGIDSLNIDDSDDLTRPAHTGLLAADIPIVEHLRGLEQLPDAGFAFHAAPVAVARMGTFPVRAYALLDAG